MDLRDVLKGLRQGQGGGGPRQAGGPRVAWLKKVPGSRPLRVYRFQEGGKPQVVAVRTVHRTGGSPPFVACTAQDEKDPGATCSLCKSWQELLRIAKLSNDISKKAAFMKADEIRPQRKYEFMVVDVNEPVGFQIMELPEGAARKLFLAAAKEAGYVGTYPPRPKLEDSEEEKKKLEAAMTEFNVLAEQGFTTLCGPAGRDIVLTYNPSAADKGDFYTLDVVRGVPRTIALPEDASVPNPSEVRQRIEAARSRSS